MRPADNASQNQPDPEEIRNATGASVDAAEIDKFSQLAAEWWNPNGKFRPLHKFNPVRLGFIRDQVCSHFGRDPKGEKPFEGLDLLDIGCGGGLLSEPMCRLGARVTGVDASANNIKTASVHAAQSGLNVTYRAVTAEDLVAENHGFDVILNMEVVEHVADVPLFLEACAAMLKPGGLMIIATINRTAKALALAIIGAEYVLGWLPRGTHQYGKLVRPIEIRDALKPCGLTIAQPVGVSYNPLMDRWGLSSDTQVNYMVVTTRPAAG